MKTLIIVALATLALNTAFAQEKNKQEKNKEEMFSMDVLNFFSPDSTKTRLDIYAEIPFDKIEFKRDKNSSSFIANEDLTLDIKDNSGISVFNKVYKEEITTPKTDIEYLANNSQIVIKNIFLKPGDYKVKISMFELSTKKHSEQEKNVSIRDFQTDPLSISDIMVVSKLDKVSGRSYITPCVSRNVSELNTSYLFFFVYRNSELQSINVHCRIIDSQNNQIFAREDTLDITKGIDIENRLFITVPTANIPIDKFKIEVTASTPQYTISKTGTLENQNINFPIDLNNLDEAISQLQYIAKDDEWDFIKDGKTDAEKKKRLIEFWNSKDPSPSTKKNEVLIEYYKRINYADKHFSTPYTKGWKTDMGMVYIIFGLPSNIERHPYEMDSKPYEIWDYYDINRQFIFVDESGFGDYRLITPIWERFNYR